MTGLPEFRCFGDTGFDMKATHFILRIELLHLERAVWREVLVPRDISLLDLHEIVQGVMPWDDEHMHEFRVKEGRRFVSLIEDPPWDVTREDFEDAEDEEMLDEHLKRKGSKLFYTYDFGDGWLHEIRLKEMAPASAGTRLRCLEGKGAAPLEDCGGPPGDSRVCELVEARRLGKLDELDEFDEWVPEGYDPDAFDLETANNRLQPLADAFEDMDRIDGIIGNPPDRDSGEGDPEREGGVFGEDEADAAVNPYEALAEADKAAFRELAAAAATVRGLEPWHYLADEEILAVEDPETGELKFLSVLGAGGEVYAVQLYYPPDGYRFWRRYFEGGHPQDPNVLLRSMHLVDVEFVDGPELEEADRVLYRLADFPKPRRGGLQWMRFRYYHPRKVPWVLPAALAPDLTRALRLLGGLETVFRDKRALADLYGRLPTARRRVPETLPVFRLRRGGNADDAGSWDLVDARIPWDKADEPPAPFRPPLEEIALLAGLPVAEETWEIGADYMRQPVMTPEGPVRAILALIVRTADGFAFPPHIEDDWRLPPDRVVWNLFRETAGRCGYRPKELWVSSDPAESAFGFAAGKGAVAVKRNRERKIVGDLLVRLGSLGD